MQYSLKKAIKQGCLIVALWAGATNVYSQTERTSFDGSIFSAGLEKKLSAYLEKNNEATSVKSTIKKPNKNLVPPVLENQVKARLAKVKSAIELTYNKDVLGWVHLYTIRKRKYTEEILRRTSFYFPVFEQALKRYGIPEELKYLPIVESALRPNAKSFANAVGLWQFIPSTGSSYGLRQDWLIDERMDIYKSTDAACRYLQGMNKYFNDWQLTLAAYNCGPGRVIQAVKKAKKEAALKGKPFKKDFWNIYKYLPKETRGYVPAFIAASYTLHYYKNHNLTLNNPIPAIPSNVVIVKQFIDLKKFAKALEEPYEKIHLLNTHLKRQVLTPHWKGYPIRIPSNKKEFYEKNKTKILTAARQVNNRNMNYRVRKVKYFPDRKKIKRDRRLRSYHVVKAGDSLEQIAKTHQLSIPEIRLWNLMPSNQVSEGQVLLLLKPRKK
ncbi:lytic transglycosylase domain-containing protein [Microscilla marina]|uniref:Membrane-bound lytic murein transglycosylase D presursor n=1 Tax=Microscilla marina ATCC 23134 TaxID=313606 RepID=A1ZUS9_MICM2|nr:lytic transglycosylase domain-containing protein [Microscilla marina]EAY25833.1 membrane-bound lytic murein transglycosylase D presursor [Microscilla marina ATCC 23134]